MVVVGRGLVVVVGTVVVVDGTVVVVVEGVVVEGVVVEVLVVVVYAIVVVVCGSEGPVVGPGGSPTGAHEQSSTTAKEKSRLKSS